MHNQHDRNIIRDLAKQKMERANAPINLERRENWLKCHSLSMSRPMILIETNGIRDRNVPFMPELLCTDEGMRHIERHLREEIWHFEEIQDDHVIEPYITCNWHIQTSDYGIQELVHHSPNEGAFGAIRWDAPIDMENFEEGFARLHPRSSTVDREASLKQKDMLEELLGDILPVHIRGGFYWTLGMTSTLIRWIGLEGLMLAMYDAPDELHRLMRLLTDDHKAHTAWLEAEGLLSLNNANDYIGSGSRGYTTDLPHMDWNKTMPVRREDLWCLSESQETVGVGPEQFAEFIFPYQKEVTDLFGLVYYGCCEPVHNRWHILKQMRNIRAVSISPWCNEAAMAEALGQNYVYSRKPNPTLISTEQFHEDAIRADIRTTLHITKEKQCPLEIIMKDVHTLNNEPTRAARWVQLAREEIASAGY